MSKEAPKVGTKFRWIGGESEFYTQGNTYYVTTDVNADGHFSIDDNESRHWWDAQLMEGKFVEVMDSPIRTRREIVPGTYGHVYVKGEMKNHPMGRVCLVGISSTTDTLGMTADELREAAHIFNQIAEVLEENAG